MRQVWQLECEVNSIIETEVQTVMGTRTATEQAVATAGMRALLISFFTDEARSKIAQAVLLHRDKLLETIRRMIGDTLRTAIAGNHEQEEIEEGKRLADPSSPIGQAATLVAALTGQKYADLADVDSYMADVDKFFEGIRKENSEQTTERDQ